MAVSSPRQKRWTRVEYERLVDLGAFLPGERLELVGGALLVRDPQTPPHATTVGLVEDALREVLGTGWTVRVLGPIALDEDSEPEPDVAVVRGSRRDYINGHPSHPALIVEAADATLRFDRNAKASLYARAGIADYWVVNLVDGVLEVRRDPVPAPKTRYGHRYATTIVLRGGEHVTPLAAPHATIPVSDLLP
ncbi:MAG TPA: Uma2 family endonuclease [Methylomirabilota bacterium]|jgi:Uma2 family endonuclease